MSHAAVCELTDRVRSPSASSPFLFSCFAQTHHHHIIHLCSREACLGSPCSYSSLRRPFVLLNILFCACCVVLLLFFFFPRHLCARGRHRGPPKRPGKTINKDKNKNKENNQNPCPPPLYGARSPLSHQQPRSRRGASSPVDRSPNRTFHPPCPHGRRLFF